MTPSTIISILYMQNDFYVTTFERILLSNNNKQRIIKCYSIISFLVFEVPYLYLYWLYFFHTKFRLVSEKTDQGGRVEALNMNFC